MRIVTRQTKDLEWWRQLPETDKEWFLAYDVHLQESEVTRYKKLSEAISESGKKKGFGVIAVLLQAIFKSVAIKAE
jgi:hypothetical protein